MSHELAEPSLQQGWSLLDVHRRDIPVNIADSRSRQILDFLSNQEEDAVTQYSIWMNIVRSYLPRIMRWMYPPRDSGPETRDNAPTLPHF